MSRAVRRVGIGGSVFLVAVGATFFVPSAASAQDQYPTVRARQLLIALDSVYARADARRELLPSLTGEAQALAWVEGQALADTVQTLKTSMLAALRELPAGSTVADSVGAVVDPALTAADSIRAAFEGFLRREFDLVLWGIDFRTSVLDSLRSLRTVVPVGDLEDLEVEIGTAGAQFNDALAFTMRSLADADALGLATGEQWARLDRLLLSRAADQSGRLQLALADRSERATRLRDAQRTESSPEDVSLLQLRLRLADQRIERQADDLQALANLLDQRDLPSATYRQQVITATGQITSDVLDPTVAVGLLRDTYDRALSWLRQAGPTALLRLAVVLGSILLVRVIVRLGWRLFNPRRRGISRLATGLLERTLVPVATILGLLVGLTVIGIDTTALLAGLGVLGVIVGLALQDTLGNLAAGIFILMYRPFDVDDIVTVGGVTGVVKAMGLASTTIVTFDHRRLFVPNNKVWGEVVENASTEGTRRIDVAVPITYEEDPSRAIELIRSVCTDYELVLEEPETLIFVKRFRDSAVDLEVHAWTASKDWWTVTTQLPRLIRERFIAEGMEAPYPRQIEYQVELEERASRGTAIGAG